jgi:hypothetical protein
VSSDLGDVIEFSERSNAILTRYIAVHNAMFGFSIRKLLFLPIDFMGHCSSLARMTDEIEEEIADADLMLGASTNFSTAKLRYLNSLREYLTALSNTINLLGAISEMLGLKSQRSGDYSPAQHRIDVEAYKDSVEEYKVLGGQLNDHLFAL